MLEKQAFKDVEAFLDDMIAYAMVTISGKTYKHNIIRREHMADGRTAVYIQITPEASTDVTVQKVQLYNKNNQLWATKGEGILLEAAQEGVLYRFTFKFLEQEV